MQDEVMNAWAAGLFEGEGTFYVNPRTGYIMAAITMTDLDVLERFAAAMGGRCRPIEVDRSKYGNTKPIYRWGSSGRPAGEVILRMLPYLGKRRSAKAIECLEALEKRYYPIQCEGCEDTFVISRAGQRFCTRQCRHAAGQRRRYRATRRAGS